MSSIWYLYRVDGLLCILLLWGVVRKSLSGCSAQELLSLIKIIRYMCCWVLQSYWTSCHIHLHAVLVGILINFNNYLILCFSLIDKTCELIALYEPWDWCWWWIIILLKIWFWFIWYNFLKIIFSVSFLLNNFFIFFYLK